MVREIFDLRPKLIIDRLDLLRPIYSQTAAYGHFGRQDSNGFTWEGLPYLSDFKALIKTIGLALDIVFGGVWAATYESRLFYIALCAFLGHSPTYYFH